jgi:hypothetical protein
MGPGSSGGWSSPPAQKSHAPWIIGGAIAASLVLVLAIAMAKGGGGSSDDDGGGGSGSGPKAVVEQLLKAGKDRDLDAAKATLCKKDLGNDLADGLGETRVVSYKIGSVDEQGDVAYVHVQVRTEKDSNNGDTKVPVIQEDGDWKVCFTKDLSIPTTSSYTTDTSSDSPSTPGSCSADQSSALQVADEYAYSLAYDTDAAKACVYNGMVPDSVTDGFEDKSFTLDHNNGDTYIYKSSSSETLTMSVTVTKMSDGKYWVTNVTDYA